MSCFALKAVQSSAASTADQSPLHAYTVGSDIVFARGTYAPRSAEGRRLIAHELTHVLQQGHGGPGPSVSGGRVLQRDEASFDDCEALLLAPEAAPLGRRDRRKEGIAAHTAIAKDFADQVGDAAVRVEIESGASSHLRTEACGDAAPREISPVKFNPFSRRSGVGIPDLVYRDAEADTQSYELAEIKFATPGCRADARKQVLNYVEKGNRKEDWEKGKVRAKGYNQKRGRWMELTGDYAFSLMPTTRFTPRPITLGDRVLTVAWCEPGVILYKAIGKKKDDEEEEEEQPEQRQQVAARPVVTEMSSELAPLQPVIEAQLADLPGPASSAEWLVLVPPAFYRKFVTEPVMERQTRPMRIDPRMYPIFGAHTAAGLYGAGIFAGTAAITFLFMGVYAAGWLLFGFIARAAAARMAAARALAAAAEEAGAVEATTTTVTEVTATGTGTAGAGTGIATGAGTGGGAGAGAAGAGTGWTISKESLALAEQLIVNTSSSQIAQHALRAGGVALVFGAIGQAEAGTEKPELVDSYTWVIAPADSVEARHRIQTGGQVTFSGQDFVILARAATP